MNTDNMILLNFIFTTVLAFVAYRQNIVGKFQRERENQQIHQEIRNQSEFFADRLDSFQNSMDRDVIQLYNDMDKMTEALPKKKTTGLNSRIPL